MKLYARIAPHVAAATILLTLGLIAPQQGRAQDLPSGEQLMEKYIEATGGRAAHENVKSNMSEGTFEMPAMGIKGTIKLWQAAPNLMYTEVDIEGFGKSVEGSTGEVVWENSSMMGPRVKTGEERDIGLRAATLHADLKWRDIFEKVEVIGVEKVDDKECYKVIRTPKVGKPETAYYDKETNLPVKVEMIVATAMGELPSTQFISDYKEVGGLLVPHTIRQQMMGQEQLIKFTSVNVNADIPEGRFDPPDAIKQLLAKEKAGDKPTEETEAAEE